MKKTVVSFADGSGSYAKSLMRLELSLKQVGFDGTFKGVNDYNHINSPLHKGNKEAVPYAFKALSIKKAMDEMDNKGLLLWCDSVVYATKSIDVIFDHIKENGYLFFDNLGFTIGDYTSDACLDNFSMTREEAFNSKMIMACVMGFNLENEQTLSFLNKYIAASTDGISYIGDWNNDNLQVSNDMRCRGHRHDQSVASFLIKKMNLTITNAQQSFFAYCSHKGIVAISENVCLWSAGI